MAAALLVSTLWDIGHSGTGKLVSEFKEKTLQTAELSEIHCTVLNVKVEEHQREDAARHGVNLIPAIPWSDEPTLTWLEYPEVHYPQIGKLTNIKYVISCGTDTKKAASAIKARLFLKAKLYLLPFPDQPAPAAALFVYDTWNKDEYGLAGFHRIIVKEFCERKAEAREPVKAFSTVLDVEISDDKKTDAKSCGITLIGAKRKKGVESKDDPTKLEWLLNHEIYYPGLSKLENILYVVGYAPKTGLAAIDIRRTLFPGAKLVLINHVSPENNCLQIEIFGSAELEEKMLRMASQADQIFSIGPTIHSYFQNAYRAEFQSKELSEIPHEEILPQAMVCFQNKTPKLQVSKGPQRHNILTYGEPSAIEKCSGIAGSIGSVADQLSNTHLKWKIQGVSQDATHTDLVDKMKSNRVLPTLHSGHSAGELLVSLQQSHLCIPAPVYMDYGFSGLEAAVFGLPTVLTCNSELANYIETHFDLHKDNWVVSNHGEENLKKKIFQHLVDLSKAFNKAKALKEALLNNEVVPESYAKFASMLTMPVGKYGEEDGKIDTKAGKIKDDLTVLVEVDDASFHKTLRVPDEQSKSDFNQLGEMEEKQNAVQAALSDCQMKLTQRSEEVVNDEDSCEVIKNTCEEKLGDVDTCSCKAKSLEIVLRFFTIYNQYRLKQTCRSGSLARAFEPLLITDEMREIAAKVGVAPLRLKVTYDQKRFREIELFFINRDGGGVRPLKSYDDIIDEVVIEDHDWDVPDNHDHQPIGDTAMTDVVQNVNIPVKYKDSVNPTKLKIESSKDACDFVDIILDNLDKFRLSEEDVESIKAPGNEIRLLRSTGNDDYQPISPLTRVAQMADGIIEFEVVTADMKRLEKPITLSVTSKESSITVQLHCRENDKVHTMVELIKENIDQFQLPPETKDAISDRSKEIILLSIPSKKGEFVGILNSFQKLGVLKNETIQFEIVDRRKPPSIEELAELCVGQKIAIFGAVGHGKSSTINTIARAFPGVQDSVAEAFGGTAAGTQVVSPHVFKVRNKLFHLIDIPGGGLPVPDTEYGKAILRKLTTWIINGNFPADLPTTYWDCSNIFTGWYRYSTSKHIGKVDAIVIVHNGTATIDRLTSTVSDVAMSKGRGIPIFGIITNIDKLNDEAEIQKQVTALSLVANIDENAIYPLSNVQEGPASCQQGGRDRDEYVLCMLRSILSRSKRSMLKQHVELK